MALVLSGLVWLGAAPGLSAALTDPDDDQLPIGMLDFPRKVRRELPDAQPGHELRLGVVRLHPSYRTAVQYDDNVFLSEEDGRDDVIFTQRPGIVGVVKLGDHQLEAGYGLEQLNFVKFPEENATNHMAHADLRLNFGDLRVLASEAMDQATGRVFNENSSRDRLLMNTVQLQTRYDRPHWAAGGGWTHNTIDHRQSAENDYGEDVLSMIGGYKIRPKVLALMEADAGLVNFDHNTAHADQTYWQLFSGLRGDPTPELEMVAKLGFQGRYMSDVNGQEQADFNGLVADASATYRVTDRDAVTGAYLRTPTPSTYASNNWYLADRFTLGYRRKLTRKWSLNPRVSWQRNGYPTETTSGGRTGRRADYFTQVSTALRYNVQEWVSAGVTYNLRARNSNLDTFDYENNRVVADVTIAF